MEQTPPLADALAAHDDARWQAAADALVEAIHAVDRTALRIWLAFFPVRLARAAAGAADRAAFELRHVIEGRYRLEDQIDSSHRFLYGHRYWPQVKAAVIARAGRPLATGTALEALVREIAATAAADARVDAGLTTAIALVALKTLGLAGLARFVAEPGRVRLEPADIARTPEQVLRDRARDDSQGLFGFLRADRKRWTVTFDEHDAAARFPLVHTQALTTAAAADRRDYRARDPRCTEGPIPVQCRSASCGTCWVGVLGGAAKLSPVEPRERQRMSHFGYVSTDDPHPVIRLACQAEATGAVSIVIPPWNGVFGRLAPEDARS